MLVTGVKCLYKILLVIGYASIPDTGQKCVGVTFVQWRPI